MGLFSRLKGLVRRISTERGGDVDTPKVKPTVQLFNSSVNSSTVREQFPNLNRRDLKYAREIGRWDVISQQIQQIRDNTVLLLERVPDKVLTDVDFHKGIGQLFRSVQLFMNSSTDRERVQAIEKVAEVAQEVSLNLREKEILEFLEFRTSSTALEIGFVVGISRSRCSTILKTMESLGLLITERSGRRIIFKLSPNS